jgi:hypothetical protein
VNPVTYAIVGLPIEVNRNAISNVLNLGTVSNLQYGKTYAVQTSPIYTFTNGNYTWGPVTYMCIIGTAGMTLDDNAEMHNVEDPKVMINNEASMAVYPNPTNGEETNLYVSGLSEGRIQVRCFDAMGKLVYQTANSVSMGSQSIIPLPTELAAGVYLVRVDGQDYHGSVRYVIEK